MNHVKSASASELDPKDLVNDLDLSRSPEGMVLCFDDFTKGPGMEEFVWRWMAFRPISSLEAPQGKLG
ncbi:MAG: hypothetical protein IPP17_25750 [Bacteroidetes bacterium]|nr:hypothetical protein [Bacteroidota bacterium]